MTLGIMSVFWRGLAPADRDDRGIAPWTRGEKVMEYARLLVAGHWAEPEVGGGAFPLRQIHAGEPP